MNLSFCAKLSLVLVASLVFSDAFSDTLTLSDSVVYGKVSRMSATAVEFSVGCSPSQATSYSIDQVRRVEINGSCLPAPPKPYSAGGELCANARLLYQLEFSDATIPTYASRVEFSGAKIHFTNYDGTQLTHAPLSSVRSISRQLVCQSATQTQSKLPSGACTEPVQWAVNFSFEPVFGNRIFTKGFSFFLTDDDGKPISSTAEESTEIRKAFQIALTWWTSAVYDTRDTLPADSRAAIEKMVSRSQSGYVLITPPQVIQAGCSDSATFVVKFLTKSDDLFRQGGTASLKAARAEVEGRTLLLNGYDYQCWKADFKKTVTLGNNPSTQKECFNLVPVMTHELGHAFGLAGHKDNPSAPSVMDSVIRNDAPYPTPLDAHDLVNVLLKPIEGMPPGRIDADGPGVAIK